jgi:hypothetical protein
VAVALPTVYLCVADATAISAGAWHISDRLTLGVRWHGLVLEEALFFLLTNIMVAQSVVLFLAPEPRARVQRWLQRVRADGERSRDGTAHSGPGATRRQP